jgi:nicotinate-nucleotide pyrophosphorylase (carboxylating)
MSDTPRLTPTVLANLAREALAEDIGNGDATTLATVPEAAQVVAALRTREDCVVAGLPLAAAVFSELDPTVQLDAHVSDGDDCEAGAALATVCGPARAVLTGERTALNFLQRLCGVATAAAACVAAAGKSGVEILDTRKTTPGLRVLEKYAVVQGGGVNHRFGLYDAIMIKDNHRQLAAGSGPGSIARAVAACRERYPQLTVEVEADTLEDVAEALAAEADTVLLDNMSTDELVSAVALRDRKHHQTRLEASGGITLERIPEVAASGVDAISLGALTHSVKAIDIGLDIDADSAYPG